MRRIRVPTPSSAGRKLTSYIHMTVLAVRHETGTGRRFGRRDQSRRMHMEQLRERIERDDYAIDPEKVADAIVRHLLDRRRS
jgi:anti-sigma28 factor (negative regulator of flagellin synthesis)